MDGIPGSHGLNGDEIVEDLDIPEMDPGFYQNPNFAIGDEDDIMGIGNPQHVEGNQQSLSSMHDSKSMGADSEEDRDADVFNK